MTCNKCGAPIPEGNDFCGKCGSQCGANSENSQNFGNNEKRGGFTGVDYTASFERDDVEANKIISLFGYILFFIPLIVAPNSKFARFHANQGLILFILGIISSIFQNIFRFGNRGWIWWSSGWSFSFSPFWIIGNVISLALLAGVIYGIINAVNGKAVEVPIIGKLRILT
jgi:uncharacterized membrane protein